MDTKETRKRKLTLKRAEQNRLAQRSFRERKERVFKELQTQASALTPQITQLERENQGLALKLALALQERQHMIHIMDRLRADNTTLKSENHRLSARPAHPAAKHFVATIKGGAGSSIMPPPPKARLPRCPVWTSHANTFLESKLDDAENQACKKPLPPDNVKMAFTEPGVTPLWTPVKSAERSWIPQPYHLSFSYSDTNDAHTLLDYSSFDFASYTLPIHNPLGFQNILGFPN